MKKFRIEKDSIGQKEVCIDAYYGVQSLRGAENFPITGQKVHPQLIRALVEIKKAAALANEKAGVLSQQVSKAIVSACDEILTGKHRQSFIVDAVSGGAGTSVNMNANEVIANRAEELLGGTKGEYLLVHPNDHVNCGQSTNDVYPSAGKIATHRLLQKAEEALGELYVALKEKAKEFCDVVKMGRTEMQDAVPVTFGQTFGAYASAVQRDQKRFCDALQKTCVVNMGGTAIGTCITASKAYVQAVVPILADVTQLPLVQAEDLVDATQNLDLLVEVSGMIKSCAVTLSKMASDFRLMSSGPRTGFGEINLPALQNGSSIMPGKVNPVIPEVINQIAYRIIGNDLTVTMAAEAGQLELNAFEPILFYSLFESLDMLTAGITIFVRNCIQGITVNYKRCEEEVQNSIGIVTALCPHVGYARAAAIAKRALVEGKTVKQVLVEQNVATKEQADVLLNPQNMI